jgi:hypothetical protein
MHNTNEALKEETIHEAEQTALDQVLARVRIDAKNDPEAYLKDSIVPEGGE